MSADESILLECTPDRVYDPLLRDLELSCVQVFYPYGFPLKVSSNSPHILAAASKSFGHFEQVSNEPPLDLEVLVTGDNDGPEPIPPTIRTRRHLVTLSSDSGHFGSCDFETGSAVLWLTPKILQDQARLRYFFLETMGYLLVTERYLAPVHASCVALNGSAVLLCGPSTAGKSTLAYACARRGFTYISDDGSHLVRDATDRVVTGNCNAFRFRPSAATLFPELGELPAIRRANGKMAIEVDVQTLGLTNLANRCRVDHVVFLNRQPIGSASLASFPGDLARAEMEMSYTYGRDQSIFEQRAAVGRLIDRDIVELTYSDLDSAVDTLENLLRGAL